MNLPNSETDDSGNNPYTGLSQRAQLYLEQHGGRASEANLIFQVFQVRNKPEVWGGILAQVLRDTDRFRRLPTGEWVLTTFTDADQPLLNYEYVVIDCETTGLHPQRNKIIELAAIKLRNGQRVDTFQTFLNPHRRIPDYITRLTGISNDHTAHAPGFGKIVDKLVEFIGQSIVVGHNIPFDMRFINYELTRLQKPSLINETLDTISLALRLHPGLRRPNLDRLAVMLGLPVTNRHRAFGDASLTADVFLKLLELAGTRGFTTLEDLRRGRPKYPVSLPPTEKTKATKTTKTTPSLFQMPLPDLDNTTQPVGEGSALDNSIEFTTAGSALDNLQSTIYNLQSPVGENSTLDESPSTSERGARGEGDSETGLEHRPERIVRPRRTWQQPQSSDDIPLTNRATARVGDLLSREHLKTLPETPGVYLMKDRKGEIIYIGKAKNIRKRVKQYYSEPLGYTRKMEGLAESIAKIDHIKTGSELEALLLESKLIKKYLPRYNQQLRNYESYPFIKINMQQRFPGIQSSREVIDDGARYFGPFQSRKAVEATIEIIEQLFPVRNCNRKFEPEVLARQKRAEPPCLRFHTKRCPGPCAGNHHDHDHDAYMQIIEEVINFLSGEKEAMLDHIWLRLRKAVADKDFEQAARLRDILHQVELIVASQQFLAAAVEGNNLLICLPSAVDKAGEVLCIYGGRLGRQVRFCADSSIDEVATALHNIWQELATEENQLANTHAGWGKKGGRVIGQEAVDEINIIARWVYKFNTDPAIVRLTDTPNWQEVAPILLERIQTYDRSKTAEQLQSLLPQVETPPNQSGAESFFAD